MSTYPVPDQIAANAHVVLQQYLSGYQQSVDDPEAFWAARAEEYLDFFSPWDKVLDWSYSGDVRIKWFDFM